MAKFGHLKKLELSADTRRTFRFPFIAGAPALDCAPAIKANRAYYSALLAAGYAAGRRDEAPATTPDAALKAEERNRDRDARLFADHCVKGWSGVLDEAGVAVPLTADDCCEWLRQIPDDMYRDFFGWLTNPRSFRDLPDVEGVAKN